MLLRRSPHFRSASLKVAAVFLLCILAISGIAQDKKVSKPVQHKMTAIEVVAPQSGEDFYEVTFRRSQRHYRLGSKAPAKYVKLLRESARKHTPVTVWRAGEESDIIEKVER